MAQIPKQVTSLFVFLHGYDLINSDLLWLRFRGRLREADSQNAVHHGRFDIFIL